MPNPQPQTLLVQVLERDNLRLAWENVAENKGMPGVDDISIAIWRRNWEERLVELARAVRANRYRPQRLRLIHIPKKKPGEFRALRIPTVRDRVLQRAVSQVLQPLYETVFLHCSYGYRPNRGLKQAVQAVLTLRDAGYTWVLNGDIDACFDRIDHELLLRFVQDDLPDASLLPLLIGWLDSARRPGAKSMGIPMGSPLSPLLANVFLHRLDLAVGRENIPLVRYADDFVAFAREEAALEELYLRVNAALADLCLRYEPSKSMVTCFDAGFTFLGVHFYRDTYSYAWEEKTIAVRGGEADMIFSDYLPEYA